MKFHEFVQIINIYLSKSKYKFYETRLPDDPRIDSHIFVIENKIILMIGGVCENFEGFNILINNDNDFTFMNYENTVLLAYGSNDANKIKLIESITDDYYEYYIDDYNSGKYNNLDNDILLKIEECIKIYLK
jgi:hypothetical protein